VQAGLIFEHTVGTRDKEQVGKHIIVPYCEPFPYCESFPYCKSSCFKKWNFCQQKNSVNASFSTIAESLIAGSDCILWKSITGYKQII